jgi:mannose/fructose/N-acetylgalactosamine-specific phosphotransferase system component IIC
VLYTVTDIVIFAVLASAVNVFIEENTEPPSVFIDDAEEVPYTSFELLRARTFILYVVFGVSPVILLLALVPLVVLKFVHEVPLFVE